MLDKAKETILSCSFNFKSDPFPFLLTVFLGSFLLFQVQPVLARYLLPWFGGGPAVWTTCLLFFQAVLLGGYLYAHAIAIHLPVRVQAALHAVLLLLALVTLPVAPSQEWKTIAFEESSPVMQILVLLSATVGLPCLLLSATGPLLQRWLSLIIHSGSPYWLYSISNLGSMLALVAYPFLVESQLTLGTQARTWSWGFAVFVVICCFCAFLVWRTVTDVSPEVGATEGRRDRRWIGRGESILCFSLAACGASMLMATTNQMCQDIASVPFLWILPLTIYLLTFIVSFSSRGYYRRGACGIAWFIAVIQACLVLEWGVEVPLVLQIASYCFTLAASCMVCHGEIAALKPETHLLTAFYLNIAAGGVGGGVFVSLIAPLVFKGYWEFHLSLAVTSLLLLIVSLRDRNWILYGGRPRWAWMTLLAAYFALLVVLRIDIHNFLEGALETSRNFYGVLRVVEKDINHPGYHRYSLMHGRIQHGFQLTGDERRLRPNCYYGPQSGVGTAIRHHPSRGIEAPGSGTLRVGVTGLGVGTLAIYGRPGDSFRFYEINPEIVRLAEKYFTFLRSSAAAIEIVPGDARISMEKELRANQPQQFDVLAIDTFTGDAIPVHLLTHECFNIYRAHMKPDGILAVHISNRYLDLKRVVNAEVLRSSKEGLQCLWVHEERIALEWTETNDWLLLTRNREFLENPMVRKAAKPCQQTAPPILWTDDYSNLFRALKLGTGHSRTH